MRNLLLVGAMLAAGVAPAQAGVIFELDLPLTDRDATVAVADSYGGSVTGGVFAADGWTTLARTNLIVIPLPVGIDATRGSLRFDVSGFEWDVTGEYWEQWALVALDAFGKPLGQGGAGDAQVMSLYRGFNPDDASKGYHLTAYFNVRDPSCTDWRDCTAETKTPNFWINPTSTYSFHHEWEAQRDVVTFTRPAGSVVKSMDMAATAPGGSVSAGQLYLMINACGGSKDNLCGPWNGPLAVKGGPIGVTYSNLHIELYGDVTPSDAGPFDADASPGAPDGGVSDAGADVDAASGAADARQMTGGCAVAPGSRRGPTAALVALGTLLFAQRKRKHSRL